jgi:hypothetical protein
VVAIILPLEPDVTFFDVTFFYSEQAVVGNRDAVCVAADVIEYLARAGKRALA